MSPNVILFLSTLSAFAISFFGALLVAAVTTPHGESIPFLAWMVCLATGGLSAFKDMRSLLKLPPVPTEKEP